MRLRSLGFAAFAAAAVMQSCQPACTPAAPPPAPPPATEVPPPPPAPTPTSLTITGQGSGHGRGLSAWGAHGMALSGASWQEIIDKYYGGTSWANTGDRTIGVRLLWADGRRDVTVISRGGAATWDGAPGSYGSLHAYQVGTNVYDVYGASGVGCGGSAIDWTLIGRSNGPITFSTSVDQSAAAPGDVLGLCRPDGSVSHYRGAIQAVSDGATNRTVNLLLIENYLRGVLSREVASSWGNAGSGRGMNTLWAMAVAARSFAHSQGRYGYAQTCDTDACQVYGGAAFRRAPDAATSFPTATQVCEPGNPTFECANTTRAVRETANVVRVRPNGQIISGEYSASHGPYSSGVNFPAVDDSASNIPGNPNYTWTRTISAADLAATYGLGTFTGAYSERDPASNANGVWAYRIVLQGTAGTVTVTNLAFRTRFGFPSHGFQVAGVN